MNVQLIDTKNVRGLVKSKIYKVLTISLTPCDGGTLNLHLINFRLINEDGIIGLYKQEDFEIVNDSLEDDWIFKKNQKGGIEIVPKILSYDGFWEDFFKDDEIAISLLKKRYPEIQSLFF